MLTRRLTGLVTALLLVIGLFGHPAAGAKTKTGVAVTGVPQPCATQVAWPADLTLAELKPLLERRHQVRLIGQEWTTPEYRPLVQIVWESLDAVSCTDYLAEIRRKTKGDIVISAGPIAGWAWGNWGLTQPGVLTLDFRKWITAYRDGDSGRLVRLVIHELGHAYNVDRGAAPAYWTSFQAVYRQHGRFSDYGHNDMETYADVLGYYVARCAQGNPFASPGNEAYYAWAKANVFGGREFGTAPGTLQDCFVPTPQEVARARAAKKAIARKAALAAHEKALAGRPHEQHPR